MLPQPMSAQSRMLGAASIVLGLLGALFYWWTPFGMVLALAGLLTGFIGAAAARRQTAELAIAGIIVSALALVLNFAVAGMGLETMTYTALR